MKEQINLDSNAVSKLINLDISSIKGFRSDIELLISGLTLSEILARSDTSKVVKDLTKLGAIWEELSERLSFSLAPLELIQCEMMSPLQKTPSYSENALALLRHRFSSNELIEKDHKSGFSEYIVTTEKKEKDLVFRKALNASAAEIIDEKTLLRLIQDYRGPGYNWDFFQEETKRYFSTASKGKIKKMLALKNRYLCLKTRVAFSELAHLGCGLPKTSGYPLSYIFRPEKGSDFDDAIAYGSVYSNYLVTEDKRLRERCLWMFKKGLIKFKVITFSEFLNLVQH